MPLHNTPISDGMLWTRGRCPGVQLFSIARPLEADSSSQRAQREALPFLLPLRGTAAKIRLGLRQENWRFDGFRPLVRPG
jgi:hypothetical protein